MTRPDPHLRAEELRVRLRDLAEADDITCAFLPSSETSLLKYFAAGYAAELAQSTQAPFRYVSGEEVAKAKILIITSHGSDLSTPLSELRKNVADGAIIAVWFWDNHLAHHDNRMTALAADFIFPSHAYAAGYLANPASVMGTHVAACTAQWTHAEAAQFFTSLQDEPRSDKLLVNYVDYTFSRRAELLRQIAAELPEAEVLVMHAEDRTRYFSKTPFERFGEWARYKSTIILPVDRDLSTRVFDALLAGLVPVVPRTIVEFDKVVPPAMQQSLGIVRIDDTDIASIRAGAVEAIRCYDRLGCDGALARHRYVLEQHFLDNRVKNMLDALYRVGTGEYTIDIVDNEKLRIQARVDARPNAPGSGKPASFLRRVFNSVRR